MEWRLLGKGGGCQSWLVGWCHGGKRRKASESRSERGKKRTDRLLFRRKKEAWAPKKKTGASTEQPRNPGRIHLQAVGLKCCQDGLKGHNLNLGVHFTSLPLGGFSSPPPPPEEVSLPQFPSLGFLGYQWTARQVDPTRVFLIL